jgi:hypothetical protein
MNQCTGEISEGKSLPKSLNGKASNSIAGHLALVRRSALLGEGRQAPLPRVKVFQAA